MGAPGGGEFLQCGVRCHIEGLAWVSEKGRGRGVEDEVVQRILAGRFVENGRACDLRQEHRFDLGGIRIGDQGIAQNHRGMEYPAQRGHRRAHAREQGHHGPLISDVAGFGQHLNAGGACLGNEVFGFLLDRSAAADKHQGPGAPLDKPLRGAQAEARGAASDKIGSVFVEDGLVGCLRRANGWNVVEAQDDFSRVARVLHVAEGLGGIGGAEGLVGKGSQNALLEKTHQPFEGGGGLLRTDRHELVGINGEVSDVVPKWTKGDAVVLVKIPLAEFEKTPEGTEDFEIFCDRFAG